MFSVTHAPLLILYLTGTLVKTEFALLRTDTLITEAFVSPQLFTTGASMDFNWTSLNTWYTRISSNEYPLPVKLSVAWYKPNCPQRTWKEVPKFWLFAASQSESSMLSDFL